MILIRKLILLFNENKIGISKGRIRLENGGFILLENDTGYILLEK